MHGNDQASETAHKALARQLRAAILQRRFEPGACLPTETELAAEYNVSRQTVRRAFLDLVAEGMVYRLPGRGTFPVAPSSHYLTQIGPFQDIFGATIDTDLIVLHPLRRQVNVEAAARLRVDSDTVYHMAIGGARQGEVFSHSTVYLPLSAGAGLLDIPEVVTEGSVLQRTLTTLLDEVLPVPIAEAGQSITAAASSEEIAKALRCAVGAPLLRVDRLYLNSRREPVELAISHFLPEHYSYRVKLRRNQG
jgi:DNA-binding GntR family transcriptional regulator